MPKKFTIPTSPEAITLDWLNEALHSTGATNHATIQSFKVVDMGDSAGFIGQLVQLKLNYTPSSEMAPASLIVKLSPPNRGPHLGSAREVRFYQDLVTRVHLPAPRCYYADLDPETGHTILLLEDLSHLKQIDRATGCTLAEAELVIQHLGQFHAHWWSSPQLQEIDYLIPFNDRAELRQERFQEWWPRFPQKLARLWPDIALPPTFLDLGHRFGQHQIKIMNQLTQAPITLIHWDTHVDNLLFGQAETDPPLMVLDWQFVGYGRGLTDVARFLIPSVPIALRRQAERGLLQTYHQVLLAQGVQDYDFASCWADYQKAFFRQLFQLVSIVSQLDIDRPHGRALVRATLPRLVAFSEDHDLDQFL